MHQEVSNQHCLRTITRADTLFGGKYTVDPYQNCSFGCLYCDSAAEPTVYVNIAAAKTIARELDGLQRGRVIIGSVHDPYQSVEEEYGLTRSLLTAIKDHGFPCHILTKSPLVLRDRSLIASFDCMVSVSLLSSEPMTARLFEPQAPSPQERLTTVQQLREAGVTAGVAIIPVLPLLTDGPQLETTIAAAAAAHACYAVHKHLELRGEQRDRFFAALKYEHPRVLERYHMWYNNGVEPDASYIQKLQERFDGLCIKYDISHSIQ